MLTPPTGASTYSGGYNAGVISSGNANNLLQGFDGKAWVNAGSAWVDMGFLRKGGLLIPLNTLEFKVGAPQGVVETVRTEQGSGFMIASAELSAQNLAIATGQVVGVTSGTPYTLVRDTTGVFTLSTGITDFEGNQYVTLPDGNATSVSVYAASSGGSALTLNTDYYLEAGAPGIPARIIRISGGAISSGATIYVVATLTPVASNWVNLAATSVVPTYQAMFFWRNPQTGYVYSYQHSKLQVKQSSYNWEFSTGGGYVEPTITFEAIQDNSFLDPAGQVAQYGVVVKPGPGT